MQRLADFIRARAAETYPEPPCAGHQQITAQVVAEICKRLPNPRSRIYDIGSGQGYALKLFTEAGHAPIGLTVNDADLETCNGYQVYKCDMHDIGRLVERFGTADVIFARHVLEHSVAPFFALHEFYEALRPNGLLYVEVPAPNTSCHHDTNNENHYSVLGNRAWDSLIQRSGFRVEPGQALTWKLDTPAGPDEYYGWLARKME